MSKNKQNISIALQGGGAHGAFAWGVMDKILEDDRFNIKGISGTSAGGMNAACVIQGLIEIKTICHCGSKATMNARIDEHGHILKEGDQIDIGGNDKYIALCRKHYDLEILES